MVLAKAKSFLDLKICRDFHTRKKCCIYLSQWWLSLVGVWLDLRFCATQVSDKVLLQGVPDSTNFVPPGNLTIAKIVLFRDWFSTKIAIYDFWISKVPFFSLFWLSFNAKLWIFPSIYFTLEQLHHGGLVFQWIF